MRLLHFITGDPRNQIDDQDRIQEELRPERIEVKYFLGYSLKVEPESYENRES